MSDELSWDPKSRALVHPRRGSHVILPSASADAAWAKVKKAFGAKLKKQVASGRKKATPEDRALIDAAVASFAKKNPPEKPDAAVEGVRAQLLGMEAHFNNMDKALLAAHDALVHMWCSAYGVPFAVAAMIETFKTARVDVFTSIYVSRDPKVLGTFGNINCYRTHTDPIDLTPWHVLRAWIAACDDATYDKARKTAEPFHDKGTDVIFRCVLSFVFPDEEKWARKTLAKCEYLTQGIAPSIYYCGHSLITCFRDKPTIGRLVKLGAYHPELAYDLLDALGAGAFPTLRTYYESRRSVSEKKKAFMPLLLVQSPQAIEWLRRQRHDPVVGKFVP
jgi:hypothetical protein